MKLNNQNKARLIIFSLFIFHASFANAQTCMDGIIAVTPTSDFSVHDDGTVTHNTTGLMWKVCSEGQTWQASDGSCSDSATTYTWQEALQIPQTLNVGGGYAGYTDWRLPNLKELKSIAELKCYSPAINETIFNNTPSSEYWSSSPRAESRPNSWGVDFKYGADSNYDRDFGSHLARLVRGGQ